MSKYVKDLVTRDIRRRLEGVEDAVLVSCVGMDANTTNELRGELVKKDIHMLVVKNSLARRATEGTRLAAAFEGATGQIGVLWGSTDFVSLVKEVVSLGERLDAEALKAVSKWPSRQEQISLLVGQILAPGANLSAALLGPGRMLNSQIKKIGEEEEKE
jgi:large subunit ribosomal protein L10